MIKKNDLLRLLDRCVKTEESVIPIYNKHVGNTLFLSEFTAEERGDVLQTLRLLSVESQRHAKIFQALVDMIGKAGKDVY